MDDFADARGVGDDVHDVELEGRRVDDSRDGVQHDAERVEALWWLAERNRTQLYSVLWQTLEISDLDEPDFGDFVLASLDEKGDIAPGDVLASLVQDAPNPTLQRDALRLIAEASQEISVGPFIEALDDPDPIVRQFARVILCKYFFQ